MGLCKQDLSTVQAMETAFSMQLDFIAVIKKLIAYDKEHAEEPEKTKYLQGFCDTQERALDTALCLLNKHKNALLEEEKKRKADEEAKLKAEHKKKMAEMSRKKEKEAIENDLKQAQHDEMSLFANMGTEEIHDENC